MIKKYGTFGCIVAALSVCLPVVQSAQAVPISEVIFAKGSDCGSFKGDLTSGRLFTIEMKAEQELVVHTDGHVQSVIDNTGELLMDQGGIDYRYGVKHSGTHTLKMVGRSMSDVKFCVY